jgi:DNA-directed RNA polymerase I and III subunit RPAC2
MLAGDGRTEENCRTFVFKGETHTLGNALKNVILQNPQVIFCGYSMPHPAEDQVDAIFKIFFIFICPPPTTTTN